MKTKLLFFVLMLFIFILGACTKEFKLKTFDSSPKIGVYCVLRAQEDVELFVYESKDFETRYVLDAYIEISDKQGNNTVLVLDKWVMGKYISPNHFQPQCDVEYFLKVYVDGYDTLYASTIVPEAPMVDTVFATKENFELGNDRGRIVSIVVNDPCQKNYYFLDGATFGYMESPDLTVDTRYVWLLWDDTYFNCSQHTFNFIIHCGQFDSCAAFYTANEDFYKFAVSLDKQKRTEEMGLFAEPVTIYSNIKNGLGIFAALSKGLFLGNPDFDML